MRVFVAVWPPDEVLDALGEAVAAAQAAPAAPNAPAPGARPRWVGRAQWHVTLRFLGDVADDDVDAWVTTVRDVAAAHRPRLVTLGPTTQLLGRGVLMIPVTGLDDVAASLSDERFHGHLTLARHATRELAGTPISASWQAREIALVRSHLGAGPARYETIAVGAFAP